MKHALRWSLGYISATFKLSSPGILYRWQQDGTYGLLDCIPKTSFK